MKMQSMLLIMFLALSLKIAVAGVLDDLALPSNTKLSWVGKRIEQNGIPLDVMQIVSSHSPEHLIRHFRQLWSPDGSDAEPAVIEMTLGVWSVISVLKNGLNIVVQVSSQKMELNLPALKRETSGFVSVVNVEELLAVKSQEFSSPRDSGSLGIADIPLPTGTLIQSRTKSKDRVNQATTLIAVNSLSVSQNYLFLKDNLPRNGWKAVLESYRNGVAILGYSKQGKYTGISVTRRSDGHSVVLITRVEYE